MAFFLDILLLFIFTALITSTRGLVKFNLPKSDIVHPKSGLVMHYLAEFRPANNIVTFTVTIPMYSDMCYLVPNMAMGKISQCVDKEATMREIRAIKDQLIFNVSKPSLQLSQTFYNQTIRENNVRNKDMSFVRFTQTVQPTIRSMTTTKLTTTSTPRLYSYRAPEGDSKNITLSWKNKLTKLSNMAKKRGKRFLPVIIAIGSGIASTVMSTVNTIQLMNLKSEMKGIKESLQSLHLTTLNNNAQIVHLNEGQFKLAQELGATQTALNKTIDLVNQHSEILRLHSNTLKAIISQTMLLRDKLATATQAMESHFIHESMDDILSNKLNLYFIHHQDLPNVVKLIIQAFNLSSNDFNTTIPMIEIITRLLVRQQIDFAPSLIPQSGNNSNLIGKLMFTSYFAAPDRNQLPFSIYKLFSIPFKFRNNQVILAKMPAYIGIEHISQQFIHWSHEEATTCDFNVMPFCRESPVQRKEYADDCLYQILTDSILQHCRIELFYDKVFIRQIGQYWAISTSTKNQCHYVSTEELEHHLVMDNEQIILPEIALIRADNTKILACDRFTIPRKPINIGTPINLIYNESVTSNDRVLISLQEALDNNTQWSKLPYISTELHAIMEFLNNTPTPIVNTNTSVLESHPISIVKITIVAILILVVLVLIYFIRRMKKSIKAQNNLTIVMPSMKKLLEKEASNELKTSS